MSLCMDISLNDILGDEIAGFENVERNELNIAKIINILMLFQMDT